MIQSCTELHLHVFVPWCQERDILAAEVRRLQEQAAQGAPGNPGVDILQEENATLAAQKQAWRLSPQHHPLLNHSSSSNWFKTRSLQQIFASL